ncbi:MAG TPA: maltotransferase domain-containing protein, partial [Polyangia bacterium]
MFSRADHGPAEGLARSSRPSPLDGRRRVVVAAVRPELDGGRFPVKRVLGDVLDIEADLVVDGHDLLAARVLYRHEDEGAWSEQALAPLGDDRWHAALPLSALGRWHYTVESWVDEWASFVWAFRRKVEAHKDVSLELLRAAELLHAAVERAADVVADHADARALGAAAARVADVGRSPEARAAIVLAPATSAAVARHPDRRFATRHGRVLAVVVDPVRARFSSWYELFPRSTAASADGAPIAHGTFASAAERLPYVAELGFDVVYLPPIHPIGVTNRKGRNNALAAAAGDRRVAAAISQVPFLDVLTQARRPPLRAAARALWAAARDGHLPAVGAPHEAAFINAPAAEAGWRRVLAAGEDSSW